MKLRAEFNPRGIVTKAEFKSICALIPCKPSDVWSLVRMNIDGYIQVNTLQGSTSLDIEDIHKHMFNN